MVPTWSVLKGLKIGSRSPGVCPPRPKNLPLASLLKLCIRLLPLPARPNCRCPISPLESLYTTHMPARNTPLKYGYTNDYIKRVARAIHGSCPQLDQGLFVRSILSGDWDELELKDRMKRISATIDDALPADFRKALDLLESAVPKFKNYHAMFFPDFLERRVTRDFEASWQLAAAAMARYTEHSSSEFAVRPMILHDQPRMLAEMQKWTQNSCEHIRRLATEGCRPRLPWAMALPPLKRDPEPILPILEALRDDTSEYVRRSVANNLNDIAKDHPTRVLGIAERWLHETPSNCSASDRRRLVKHACRTLLRAGDPRAMPLFGFRDPTSITVENFRLDQTSIKLGESIEFAFRIGGDAPIGRVRVDYAVFYQKANGKLSPKVFKISEFDCKTAERAISRRHKFRDLSTRKHHAGPHQIELRINGVAKAKLGFELRI